MKLYNSMGPNPKLVRMFAAEKDFAFEVEEVDLGGGANRQEPFLSKNPAGQLPCVELDDGQIISETIAICELIEEQKPSPALIGSTPAERAEARMWVRRAEWKVIQPMADGFRFAEGLPIFKDRIRTLPDAASTRARPKTSPPVPTLIDHLPPGSPGRVTPRPASSPAPPDA